MAIEGLTVSWSKAEVVERAHSVLAPIKPLLLGRTAWFSHGEDCIIWECTEAAFQDDNVPSLADMVRYFAECNAEDAACYEMYASLRGDPRFEADFPLSRRIDLSGVAAALQALADMWEAAA